MKCIRQKEYPDSTETFPLYPKKTTYIILKQKNKLKKDKLKEMNLAINYFGNFNQNSKFGMATKKMAMSDLLELYDNRKVSIPSFKNITLKEKTKPKFVNASFREILLPSKPNKSLQFNDECNEEIGDVFSFNCNEIRNANCISNGYYNDKKLSLVNSTNSLSFQEPLYTNGSESLFSKMGFGTHFHNISLNKFTKNNLMKSKCSIIREALPIFPVINTHKRQSSKSVHRREIALSNYFIHNEHYKHKPHQSRQSSYSHLTKHCKLD